MHSICNNKFIGLFAVVMTTAIIFSTAEAGEYHTAAQQLICSDCHIMHASKDSVTQTPFENLIKNPGGEIGLCMSCHDGADSQAPDIVANGISSNPSNTVTIAYSSKYGSSAGFFQSDYLANENPYGHDLLPQASVSAPLSNSYLKIGGFVCTDCHDPHGSPEFRNLIKDPNPNHAGSFSVTLNTDAREAIPVNSQTPNPAAAYDTGNISFYSTNTLNAWCTDCHDQLADNSIGSSPAHFKGHPSNVEIGGIESHTNSSNWLSPVGQGNNGFGSEIGDGSAGIPRVRYSSPTGSNTLTNYGDTVSCLSCHKAHGSKYKYSFLWPYTEGGADKISGCQQCHFK